MGMLVKLSHYPHSYSAQGSLLVSQKNKQHLYALFTEQNSYQT